MRIFPTSLDVSKQKQKKEKKKIKNKFNEGKERNRDSGRKCSAVHCILGTFPTAE
jgi:hypothetical protein